MSFCGTGEAAALAINSKNSQRWSIFSVEDPEQIRTEGSHTYAILVCVFASLGGLYFGYDQGVTSGVLIMKSFLEDFCIDTYGTKENCSMRNINDLPKDWISFTTNYSVLFYAGCIAGAFLANFVSDLWGRRVTIFVAGIVFCGGTSWAISVPAKAHASLLAARFFLGSGVGASSFSLPLFGAEMAPSELRGLLSGFMQMTIVIGILTSQTVNYFVQLTTSGWRLTNGIAMIPPAILLIGVFYLPESPRWLYKWKGKIEAEKTLKKLRMTDNVHLELEQIGQAIEDEGNSSIWDYSAVFSPDIRGRLLIAIFLQILQQATGINPTFNYGGQIFNSVLNNQNESNNAKSFIILLIFGSVNCISTIPALYWCDKYGRRILLLLGAVGMFLGHFLSATFYLIGCKNDICQEYAGYSIVIFTCFFIFNFAISWGPICWIYPAEIFPMHVRAKAVSISTMANWTSGLLMLNITLLYEYLNCYGTFYLFGAFCAFCFLFVYRFCPETSGVPLEDIEAIFLGKSDQIKDIYINKEDKMNTNNTNTVQL